MKQNHNQPNIQSIIAGDPKEFAKLVDMQKNLVFTVALRMLRNREEAEEVAQDTFVKVYKSIKNFKGDSKFSTWIYKIAYNSCLDRIKKNKKTQNTSSWIEFSNLEIEDTKTVLDDFDRQEKRFLLEKCMKLLSPKDSAILTLYYFEEKDLGELAKILELTENTVKVRLFRARARLATVLKEKVSPETIKDYG